MWEEGSGIAKTPGAALNLANSKERKRREWASSVRNKIHDERRQDRAQAEVGAPRVP